MILAGIIPGQFSWLSEPEVKKSRFETEERMEMHGVDWDLKCRDVRFSPFCKKNVGGIYENSQCLGENYPILSYFNDLICILH